MKEQTICFEQGNGRDFMDCYDDMPPELRERVRSSPYNLCAACVDIYGVEEMERQIRKDLDGRT